MSAKAIFQTVSANISRLRGRYSGPTVPSGDKTGTSTVMRGSIRVLTSSAPRTTQLWCFEHIMSRTFGSTAPSPFTPAEAAMSELGLE